MLASFGVNKLPQPTAQIVILQSLSDQRITGSVEVRVKPDVGDKTVRLMEIHSA